MNFPILRGGIAITAAFLIYAEFARAATAPTFTPPRITQRPENFDACHAEVAPTASQYEDPDLDLTIAADGTLENSAMPEGSPVWMKELSDCALALLTFSPATRDGAPVEGNARLKLKLRERGPESATGIAIENIGPLITHPRLGPRDASIDECFQHSLVRTARFNRFIVTMTVRADGTVTDVKLPIGSAPWQEVLTGCILDRLTFTPGTSNGSPVDAEATIPIVMRSKWDETNSPVLRSTDEELEAAYRACYPSDMFTVASAIYSFIISTRGLVGGPMIVQSSGDPRLDEAGVCVLKRLEFTPLKLNGRSIRAKVTWELPIRPPR